jgi:hypothetical protein
MTPQEAIEFLREHARFTRSITAIPCDGDAMLLGYADEFDAAADTVAALEAENERLRKENRFLKLEVEELSRIEKSEPVWDRLTALAHKIEAAHTSELDELRAQLAKLTERRFPIMGGPSIPWSAIAPYDGQAQCNHSQNLERLAERGGLSPVEAYAVMRNLKWRDVRLIPDKEAIAFLESVNQLATARTHKWVAVAECGELEDGRYIASNDQDLLGELTVHGGEWFLRGEWEGEMPTHILNPHLGPIGEPE